MNPLKHIEVLHLGDELLLGLRVNTHLEAIGSRFSKYGLTITRDHVIRDHREEILETLETLWPTTDLLITTGGLGPTVDDITRQTIAEFFSVELVFDPNIKETIETMFRNFGKVMSENNLRQCYVPGGATVLPNPNGTAPGIWFERDDKILVMLPGPTREMIPMFESQVISKLRSRGLIEEKNPFIQLRTCGVGESFLENRLKPLEVQYPQVDLAYCVHSGYVDLRLSSQDENFDLQTAANTASEILGDDLVGFGNPDLAKSIIRFLTEKHQTLSTAESCTGGMIASRLTDVAGASQVFVGGAITYSEEAKIQTLDVPDCLIEQHGVVSAEVAMAMATGAAEHFSTDYAISATGFAGPDGGNEKDPVGTIYIGYHSPSGAWSKRFVIRGERHLVRQRATTYALDTVRRKLRKYLEEDEMHRQFQGIHEHS